MTEEMQKRLDAMPLEEKFKLMASAGGTIALSDNTIGVEEYFMAAEDEPQEMKDKRTTCYPHASAIAATWSTETAEQIGKAQAQDARRNGIAGITRPAMNIKRHPLNGRNFEYYSEDPVLSGELAGSYVLGMQSEGVAACVKHFCANNHESERMVTNEIISERALREI